MAKAIIRALRKMSIPAHLRYTVQELAHLAHERSGRVSVAYQFLAHKTGRCRRTMINHIRELCALKIIGIQKYWRPGRWLRNTYTFRIRWVQAPAWPAPTGQKGPGETLASTLPPEAKQEKGLSLAEEKRILLRGMAFLAPGTARYADHQRELDRLSALEHV